MTEPSGRTLLVEGVATFVLSAVLPRLWAPERRRRRLRPRRFVAYLAVNAGTTYAMHVWLRPRLERILEDLDRGRDELRARLGREPTTEEVLEHLGVGRAASAG